SEAYHAFMQCDMDVLVLEDCILIKEEQPLPAIQWADPISREPIVPELTDGIARLFVPTSGEVPAGMDVTALVQQFYEKTPFPNYEDIDNPRALLEKSRAGTFARLLNEQIPFGASVLEVGCGTGQ